MKITTELDFLVNKYGMKYKFQRFEKASNGEFYGPCDAFSYYNEFGCFTIYNIVQRGELDFYCSDKISFNQSKLMQKSIDLEYRCKEIWDNMPNKRFGMRKVFFQTLAKAIDYQIQNHGAFYGIKI